LSCCGPCPEYVGLITKIKTLDGLSTEKLSNYKSCPVHKIFITCKYFILALCSTGHEMRYGLSNTTKVILLTAVVMDIGFENVTDMSLSES